MIEGVEQARAFAGLPSPTPAARERLLVFRDWLEAEAIPAGGLGPGEAAHVERRHLADSLVFARGWRDRPPPRRLIDLGSGVGLPGIPLAIALPDTQVVLVDRSERRVRLARRAVRVVDLGNVEVVRASIEDDAVPPADVVTARAVVSPERLLPVLQRLVASEGVGVVGGPSDPGARVAGYLTVPVPPEILDRQATLLIMARP